MKKVFGIFLLLCCSFFSFLPYENELVGKWIVCGDFIMPEEIDVLTFERLDTSKNVYRECDSEAIKKYSIWTFSENNKIDLAAYTGEYDAPIRAASSNYFWVKWHWRKGKKELWLTSREKTKIRLEVLSLTENILVIKKKDQRK